MSLNGRCTEEKIWNYLKGKGLCDFGIAGLMGNLEAESSMQPNNLQNSYQKKLGYSDESYTAAVDSGKYANFAKDAAGYGLAQWTYHTRKAALLKFAQDTGRSIGDLELQLDFLWKELSEGYTGVLKVLQTATSVQEASDKVLVSYERPADMGNAVKNKRAGFGMAFYNQYAGQTGFSAGTDADSSGMTPGQKQCLLAYLGYYGGPVNGTWTDECKDATTRFQKDFGGIAVDGIVGPETGKALTHAVAYGMTAKNTNDDESEDDFWGRIKYWSRDEFKCRCGEYHTPYCDGFPVEPDHTLVELADNVRGHFGRPGYRSSGIRCEQHNADSGGVSNSRHLRGKALDFRIEGHTAAQVLAYVLTLSKVRYAYAIDGTYVHMDVE